MIKYGASSNLLRTDAMITIFFSFRLVLALVYFFIYIYLYLENNMHSGFLLVLGISRMIFLLLFF